MKGPSSALPHVGIISLEPEEVGTCGTSDRYRFGSVTGDRLHCGTESLVCIRFLGGRPAGYVPLDLPDLDVCVCRLDVFGHDLLGHLVHLVHVVLRNDTDVHTEGP